MKQFNKCRVLSFILTFALLLGMLPADMLGGIAKVQAATATVDGVVVTRDDAWTVSGGDEVRTTEWDFTENETGATWAEGSSVQGITYGGGTVQVKAKSVTEAKTDYGNLDVCGQYTGKSWTEGTVNIPLNTGTTSVTVQLTLSGTGSKDTNLGGRCIKVGSATKTVTVFQKAGEITGDAESFDGNKTWSKALDSSYIADSVLKITGIVGENKIASISVTETRTQGSDGTDSFTIASSGGSEGEGNENTELPTSWDLGTGAGFAGSVEGSSDTYNQLVIDATNGKLAYDSGAAASQFNAGTILKVPVSGSCTITTVAHSESYLSWTIGGVPAENVTSTYSYTGEAGYVDIVSTGEAYIKSITVEYPEAEATTYAVTLNLGSGPDLAGKSVTYNFTNAEGETSSFTDASAIKLADGTYTVSLGGYFAQCPYTIKEGTSLTVSGAAKTHNITFEEITKWTFASMPDSVLYQKNSGYYNGLYVDASASTGKFGGHNGSDCFYFNYETIVKVPVKGTCTVTVKSYPDYYYYTIGGEAATADVSTYDYVGDAGYVEIEANNSSNPGYIEYIELTYPQASTTTHTFDAKELASYVDVWGNTEKLEQKEYEIPNNDYFSLIGEAKLKIEAGAQKFTDENGKVVFESTHRIHPGGGGTSKKRAIKFTTTSAADVRVYWGAGDVNRQMYILKAGDEVITKTSVEAVKNGLYVSTLEIPEAGTYYLCGKDGTNYIYRVDVTEAGTVQSPTVSTVTATQDASDKTGATVTVSYTGTAGGEGSKYVIEASKDDGANWIRVETADGAATSGTTTVDLSDEKFGFGTWKFRVKGSNEVVASETIVYAASTYTLSGTYNTGLADASLLTGLTFTATTDSIYEVPAVVFDTTAHTYSVVLEKGTTYEVAAVGVDEYSMTTPSAAIKYSADTTLNLTFVKKVFYPITISLGATPDLTGKNVTYTFTHEDGAVYSFASASGITLRDGKYTVSLGGDIAKMAYDINKGATLEVSGAAVNHAITFKALTAWDLTQVKETIQGNKGYFKGLYIDATTGKVAPNGNPSNSAQFNAGAIIRVPVSGPCSIAVTAHEGKYALYTINGQAADTANATTTIEYTGGAGTIDIVSTGSAYICSITTIYPATEVEFVKQSVMPFIPEDDTDANNAVDTDGKPRVNKKDALTVQPVGQKLNLSQTGGNLADKYVEAKDVTYYVFPKTSSENKLEFDLLVTESKATGNGAGFFGGVFTDNYVYTLGLRAGGKMIRGIYSKTAVTDSKGSGFGGAGSPTEENIGINKEIHYEITVSKGRPSVTITFIDDDGVEQSRTWSQNPIAEPNGSAPTELYYGFALANVSATITNMRYTDAAGKVVHYDQNACYYPEGAAPVASSVTAVAAESREYIDVTWTGTVPEYDGTYVVEMQRDGGEWVELSQDVTGFNYRYNIPGGEGGNYKFRVCGQLGKKTLGGSKNVYATMANTIYVMGALTKPVVTIDASATELSISWGAIDGAEYYQIYRYSYDEGEEGAKLVADKYTATSYTDTTVEQDMPYYYQVKAISESTENASALSDVVWQVATPGHSGAYVYEDEATEIFVSKKSYDTVFTNMVTLAGNVYGEGTLVAEVNGDEVTSQNMKVGDPFVFELDVAEGRNDVNLLFTDEDGKVTRKTFNFVYLTNYDMVVDASYTGTDGAAVNGIPTYKTVQAAVNSVPSGNTDSKVILVLAGSYVERLEVNTPYISLVGEDRENTSIHCYPADLLGSEYAAGGAMDKRCAIYIKSGATGFSAENITFANDFDFSKAGSQAQADAIRVDSDKTSFVNCKFVGVQDTLYMDQGKHYFYKSRIEGLVDFIYSGEKARAFFNDCDIVFVYEPSKMQGYVAAPKTAVDADYGLTFYNCTITAEEGCAGPKYLLARPWGANAYVTWINCYMGKVLNEYAPYGDMSGNMHVDARFFEYGSYGPSFAINADRRQISGNKAGEMITADYLGWDAEGITDRISEDHYVGDIVTNRNQQFGTAVRDDSKYLKTDGDDTGLKMYDLEGYGEAYGVTGGGLLKETNRNYYAVANAEEFLNALLAVKASGMNSVIELTADINLGCKEVENFASYKSVIVEYGAQALTHPTLMETGVSQLKLENFYNLTIFSQNGASIKHANITMKNTENIIIRNIKFDELWEWDEATGGDYDRNDWDFMTIDSGCNGIWIDHCTFYKAYDGIIDIKNPNPISNVTISWCEFLPGSEGDEFFDVMMDDIFNHPENYPSYQKMIDGGMTEEQVYGYAHGQKKTHLLGQDDSSVNAAGIRLTMANNYYKNSMDRLPRLRYGNAHVYNCIMDAQELLDLRLSISNPTYAQKVVSNGAISTCDAQLLLENCYINGIQNALSSGNSNSPSGYINAINSVYYMDGELTKLEPIAKSKVDDRVLVTDADEFIADLPYGDYYLYDAETLDQVVLPSAGAGKLDLTVLQWERTSYNDEYEAPTVVYPEVGTPGTLPESELTDEIMATTGVKTVGELIGYLKDQLIENGHLPKMRSRNVMVVSVDIVDENGMPTDIVPVNGLRVKLPYPNEDVKADRTNYNFVIGHMLKNGSMEYFRPEDIRKTPDGLEICIKSASPFIIGWAKVEVGEDDDDDDDGDNGESSKSENKTGLSAILSPKTFFDEDSFIHSILWPDTDSEKAAQNEQSADANASANAENDAAEDAQVAAGAVVQNAEKEGNNLFVLIVVAAIAVIVASGVVLFRKKNEEM